MGRATAKLQPLKTWPGAFGIYKYSRDAIKLNLVTLLVLWIVNIVIANLAGPITVITDIFFALAINMTALLGVQHKKITFSKSMSKSLSLLLRMIGLMILVYLALLGTFLLFIVPFFMVLPRLVLAPYYLIDKNTSVMGAFKASWHDSKDHVGKVWGIASVYFLMALLCVTIIGIPFAIYLFFMYSAAPAVLYEFIQKQKK